MLSSYQQFINKAYKAYVTYQNAWAMHKVETKNGMDVVVLHNKIVEKFKQSLPDLGLQYFIEPEVREICTQSIATCDAMITEFGTEMPPVTVLDPQQ